MTIIARVDPLVELNIKKYWKIQRVNKKIKREIKTNTKKWIITLRLHASQTQILTRVIFSGQALDRLKTWPTLGEKNITPARINWTNRANDEVLLCETSGLTASELYKHNSEKYSDRLKKTNRARGKGDGRFLEINPQALSGRTAIIGITGRH